MRFIAIATFFFSLPIFADGVFLKSGEIIQGKILKLERKTIKIRDETGKVYTIDRRKELRFFMGNLDLRKKYIYKKNGDLLVGYIVAEERDGLIFRENLRKNIEMKIHLAEISTRSNKIVSMPKIEDAKPSKNTLIPMMWRTLVLPGWGNLYVRQKRGYIYGAAWFITGAAFLVAHMNFKNRENDYLNATSDLDRKYDLANEARVYRGVSSFAFASVYLGAFIDILFFRNRSVRLTNFRFYAQKLEFLFYF